MSVAPGGLNEPCDFVIPICVYHVSGAVSSLQRCETSPARLSGFAEPVNRLFDHSFPSGEIVAELEKTGGVAAYVRTDVAKETDVVKAVHFVTSEYGRLDVAFNNAGIESVGPLDQSTDEQYRRLFDVNVWGVLSAMKHEITATLENGSGCKFENAKQPIGGRYE